MPDTCPPGTYLGIDYGQKFIGVAVGQSISKTASALEIIKGNQDHIWQSIARIIEEWHPVGIVVGVPETANGQATKIHNLIESFIHELSQRHQVDIYTINERLSSYAAGDLLSQSTKRTITRLDDTAAAVILQTWFNEYL